MTNGITNEFIAVQQALAGLYSLEQELGRGGMGIVYLAHEVALDRPVALKLLPPTMAAETRMRERFLREARTAAKLSHPNIVPIYAVHEIDGFVFFAMAYVDGETLGQRIRAHGPLPKHETTRILREVSWALGYAHSQGIVHRDVKPDNVLLESGSGRALVTDFGIAHVLAEPGMTVAGEILGTAEFMSPEQASGEPIDARSDVYALGVLGFYLLSGRLPFEAESVRGLLAKHITQPAPAMRDAAPETPRRLAAVVDRCLRKEPDQRFADGQEVADELGNSLEERRELPIPIRVFLKHNREAMRSFAAAALVSVLFFFPPLVSAAVQGSLLGLLSAIGLAVALVGTKPVVLGRAARQLLKAGYVYEDAISALKADLDRRREEIAFEYGTERTPLERKLRMVGYVAGGGTLMGIAALGAEIGPAMVAGVATFLALATTLASAAFASSRRERRRDIVGERRLKFWSRRFGRWVFKLARTGLKQLPGTAGATFRPTELAIGMAADRLFDALPTSVKQELRDLPDVVRQLEGDAQHMRKRVDELNDLLAQVGGVRHSGTLAASSGDATSLGDHRDETVERLLAARDLAQQRLTDAVTALETIRLDLLRMQAGVGTLDGLTRDLDAARSVVDELESLLAGQEEVERVLKGG